MRIMLSMLFAASFSRPAASFHGASSRHRLRLPLTRRYYSTSTTTATAAVTESLMNRYDAFILDQFGVLHNGVAAMDGAVDLCEHLASASNNNKKKQLVILSNTSAPSHKALEKLQKLGFHARLFQGAVTSGDEAAKYIRDAYRKPCKTLMLTWDTTILNNPRLTAMPQDFLDLCGSHVQVAAAVEEADFVLLHGSEVWHRGGGDNLPDVPLGSFIEDGSFTIVDEILQQCLARQLPLVCANPDFVVQTPSGGAAYMPGKIAQRYQELAANSNVNIDIHLFGKPQPQHFQACLDLLQLPADRVAHVGDSLHHDVAGATAAGIDSIWITSGIHQSELETSFGQVPDASILQKVIRENGNVMPTHVVSAFRR